MLREAPLHRGIEVGIGLRLINIHNVQIIISLLAIDLHYELLLKTSTVTLQI
jgi:hypothetical protein